MLQLHWGSTLTDRRPSDQPKRPAKNGVAAAAGAAAGAAAVAAGVAIVYCSRSCSCGGAVEIACCGGGGGIRLLAKREHDVNIFSWEVG